MLIKWHRDRSPVVWTRLTQPLVIVAICYWKCGVATNISHWLKVHSRWFKNFIFAKKCILISWFSNIAFITPSHFIIVPYFILWVLDFWIPSLASGCQTVYIQIRPDVLLGLIWVQTVCKGYQQITKVATSWQRIKYRTTSWYNALHCTFWLKPWLKSISFGSNFFHLAKVLATTNSELQM